MIAALVVAVLLGAGWLVDRRTWKARVAGEQNRAEHWKQQFESREDFLREVRPIHEATLAAREEMKRQHALVQNDVDALRQQMNAYRLALSTALQFLPKDKREVAERNVSKYIATLPQAREPSVEVSDG